MSNEDIYGYVAATLDTGATAVACLWGMKLPSYYDEITMKCQTYFMKLQKNVCTQEFSIKTKITLLRKHQKYTAFFSAL
jgi:hypothetical protein